ncbi:MAG: hypothetical protein ABIH72_02245 [archaeon]
MKTLDMKFIRYLNLFEKICKVRTKNCFEYNNFIFFAVQPFEVSKAIGEEGRNIRKVAEILGKRAKIVTLPRDENDIKNFILSIINPLNFKDLKLEVNEIIIEGGKKNKAALIGRGRRREAELNDVVKHYFNKSLKIV